jgi:hypothetical protein
MIKNCPVCKSSVGVREFIYGMPSEEPDSDKYVLGGCCFSEDMPDFRCLRCSIDFYLDKDVLRYHVDSTDSEIGLE